MFRPEYNYRTPAEAVELKHSIDDVTVGNITAPALLRCDCAESFIADRGLERVESLQAEKATL